MRQDKITDYKKGKYKPKKERKNGFKNGLKIINALSLTAEKEGHTVNPEDIERSVKSCMAKVLYIIERYPFINRRIKHKPFVKGDYFLLQYYFYRTYQPYLFRDGVLQWKIWKERRAYSPETITRSYREVREKGYIKETKKTKERRASNEQAMRYIMPNLDW